MKLPPAPPSLGRTRRVSAEGQGWFVVVDEHLRLADRVLHVVARRHQRNGQVEWTMRTTPPNAPPLQAAEHARVQDELVALGCRQWPEEA